MSKEPIKSLINKVGTFRNRKHGEKQRPSVSDLKFGEADESMMRQSNVTVDENFMGLADTSELDTTVKSFTSSNNSFRAGSSHTLNTTASANTTAIQAITNGYDRMTPEQINEEFERSVLVRKSNFKILPNWLL